LPKTLPIFKKDKLKSLLQLAPVFSGHNLFEITFKKLYTNNTKTINKQDSILVMFELITKTNIEHISYEEKCFLRIFTDLDFTIPCLQ